MCYYLYIYTGTESLNSGSYTCTWDTLLNDLCLQLQDSNSNLIKIFVIFLLTLYMHLRKTIGTPSVVIIKEGMLSSDAGMVGITKNGTVTYNLSTSSAEQPARLRIIHGNIAR